MDCDNVHCCGAVMYGWGCSNCTLFNGCDNCWFGGNEMHGMVFCSTLLGCANMTVGNNGSWLVLILCAEFVVVVVVPATAAGAAEEIGTAV